LRSHVPGLGRREEGLAKTKEGLLGRLRLVMGYYNFCLPVRQANWQCNNAVECRILAFSKS
jgi:hypothetical protein